MRRCQLGSTGSELKSQPAVTHIVGQGDIGTTAPLQAIKGMEKPSAGCSHKPSQQCREEECVEIGGQESGSEQSLRQQSVVQA